MTKLQIGSPPRNDSPSNGGIDPSVLDRLGLVRYRDFPGRGRNEGIARSSALTVPSLRRGSGPATRQVKVLMARDCSFLTVLVGMLSVALARLS
jgi:hypothetical protein